MLLRRFESDDHGVRPADERNPRMAEMVDQPDNVIRVPVDVVGRRSGRVITLAMTPMVEENTGVLLREGIDVTGLAP